MVFVDCSTEDLKRLNTVVVDLSMKIEALKLETIENLEMRDKLIVLETSVRAQEVSAQRMIKKFASPRFYRSIARAYRITRAFRVKPEVN